MIKFGKLKFEMPFFQAPLSGYSDHAMRKMALRFGAPLTFAGVVLAKSAANPKVINKRIFHPGADEHPVGGQILGEDAKTMAVAAKALAGLGYDIIDLNFACPAPKVLRRKRGGFLLRDPDKVLEIFNAVREAVDCPVTAKLRTGYADTQQSRDNFWEIAERLGESGIDGLTVHGRDVLSRYKGQADWEILGRLKKRLPDTTIVGSGDLFDCDTIAANLKASGLDGALIARGAVGNPWIFRELKAFFSGGEVPGRPDLQEQGNVILEHYELVCELYSRSKSVRYFRKFLAQYVRRHPERKKVVLDMLGIKRSKELVERIRFWYGLN